MVSEEDRQGDDSCCGGIGNWYRDVGIGDQSDKMDVVVLGRCVIRNHGSDFLAKLLHREQEMKYAEIGNYESLYARYLDRPVSDLIDLAGDVKGKVVWDLCCGGGALSRECLSRGAAKVIAVDKCGDMTSQLRKDADDTGCWDGRFRLEIAEVQNYVPISIAPNPDFVFCRQAVNYWLDEGSATELARRVGKGCVFVFNTFNEAPPEKPLVKEYKHDGVNFVEVSWLEQPDTVHHVQVGEGMEPHVTRFRWIPPSKYIRILGGFFAIQVVERGRASLYRCERKG